MRSQGDEVQIITIKNGADGSTIPISLGMLPGVLPLKPTLLARRGVLDVHVLPDAVSAIIYFVTGIRSICGVNLISANPWSIPELVGGVKKGMVR